MSYIKMVTMSVHWLVPDCADTVCSMNSYWAYLLGSALNCVCTFVPYDGFKYVPYGVVSYGHQASWPELPLM